MGKCFALVFWAKAMAPYVFGTAWIVASKYLSIFTEAEEQLTLLEPRKRPYLNLT